MAVGQRSHEIVLISMIVLSLFTLPCDAVYGMITTSQFQEWYQEFGQTFQYYRDHNCSAEYALYMTGNRTGVPIDRLTGGGNTNRLVQPLVNCILEHTSDFIKGNMASAAVMLGLTPTILSMLGPTIDEIATLSVIGRRPLLAFLVAGSSPVVNPWSLSGAGGSSQQPIQRGVAVDLLHDSPWRYRISDMHLTAGKVMILEYILVMGSVATLAWTCAELALRTICTFAPEANVLPLVWTWVSLVVHIPGAYAMSLRLRVVSNDGNKLSWSFRKWLLYQFVPYKHRPRFELRQNRESFKYVVTCWLSSFLVVIHMLFGTLTWSSLVFVSVRDSLTVIARYMLCQLISKAVLMIELATLRDALSSGVIMVEERENIGYELPRRHTAGSNSEDYKPGATLLERDQSFT